MHTHIPWPSYACTHVWGAFDIISRNYKRMRKHLHNAPYSLSYGRYADVVVRLLYCFREMNRTLALLRMRASVVTLLATINGLSLP